MTSLVLQHKPDSNSTTYVQGRHFTITLPATIELQLDGSALELSECLNDDDKEALGQIEDKAKVTVTYRIDVLQQALPVAIPCAYDNTLFANAPHATTETARDGKTNSGPEARLPQEQIDTLLKQSKQVTVMGVTPNPDKPHTYIIAGTTRKESTGDVKPPAIRVTPDTKIYQRTGEAIETATVEALQAGTVLAVTGKESKRSVIGANTILYA